MLKEVTEEEAMLITQNRLKTTLGEDVVNKFFDHVRAFAAEKQREEDATGSYTL